LKKHHIVIGGGIAGIITSHCLSQKGYNVILAESTNKLGGLLSSKVINDLSYDYGTHFLRETGIEKLDEFMFGGLSADSFDILKSGSFYQNLFENSGFVSDNHLSNKIRKKCFNALLDSHNYPMLNFTNLKDQLIHLFGIGYYEHLLKGIIHKFFFTDASNLSPHSHQLFGLGRIVAGDKLIIDKLKQNSASFDSVLAHHSFHQGKSNLKSLYPKSGGVGSWIELLESKLIDSNVLIIKEAKIDLKIEKDLIQEICINGNNYNIDKLYWTVPPVFLYKAAGLNKTFLNQPQRLTSIVVDIKFKGNYLTDLYYIQNFDPNFKSFRVTLYDNYNILNSEFKRITIEFLTDKSQIDEDQYGNIAIKEIYDMKLVNKKLQLIIEGITIVNGSFPVPSPKFKEDNKTLINRLSHIKNLSLFGKASGKNWFMGDVIMEIYNSLNKTI